MLLFTLTNEQLGYLAAFALIALFCYYVPKAFRQVKAKREPTYYKPTDYDVRYRKDFDEEHIYHN